MLRKSKLEFPPLDLGSETPGRRLARLRKERGFTQIELAQKTSLVQALASDDERGKLRLNAEMLTRFALALEVTSDQILGLDQKAKSAAQGPKPRRLWRRLQLDEDLPEKDQRAVLRLIHSRAATPEGP